jgi:hypothetical protein
MERRHFFTRRETFHGFHQVERGAEHGFVAAGRNHCWMAHSGSGKCSQHARLSAHCLIRVGAKVLRRAPKDEASTSPLKPQQYVLRATSKQARILERSGRQALCVHPDRQRIESNKDFPVLIAARNNCGG